VAEVDEVDVVENMVENMVVIVKEEIEAVAVETFWVSLEKPSSKTFLKL